MRGDGTSFHPTGIQPELYTIAFCSINFRVILASPVIYQMLLEFLSQCHQIDLLYVCFDGVKE